MEIEKADISVLWEIIKTLRGEKGCPWDKKQTPQTLKKYLIEETYEALEAIEEKEPQEIKEELGDLLFIVLFIIYLYEEMKLFTLKDLIYFTAQKMIKRHPHVFGNEVAKSAEEVISKWQKIKKQEKKGGSVLGNIPKSLPALQRAFRLGERASRVGFDWQKAEDIFEKMEEEIREIKNLISNLPSSSESRLKEEIGDLLFTIANFARKLNINPEEALKMALYKFENRFQLLEKEVEKRGLSWEKLSIEDLDKIWEEIKKHEKSDYS